MCIINNSYKFIFVHVPKAAGTSLTNAFGVLTNYCDLEIGGTTFGERIQPAYRDRFGVAKHSTAAELMALVGAVTWARYFTFAFVRDPFARAVSTFNFLRKWDGANDELTEEIRSFETFDDYVMSDIWARSDGPDHIFRPQVHWLRRSPGLPRVLPHYIGKTETIATDFRAILAAIQVPEHIALEISLKQLNVSEPTVLPQNPKVIAKIVAKYKADFQTFGYPTDPPSAKG